MKISDRCVPELFIGTTVLGLLLGWFIWLFHDDPVSTPSEDSTGSSTKNSKDSGRSSAKLLIQDAAPAAPTMEHVDGAAPPTMSHRLLLARWRRIKQQRPLPTSHPSWSYAQQLGQKLHTGPLYGIWPVLAPELKELVHACWHGGGHVVIRCKNNKCRDLQQPEDSLLLSQTAPEFCEVLGQGGKLYD